MVEEIHKGNLQSTTALKLMQTAKMCAKTLLKGGKINKSESVQILESINLKDIQT